MKKFFNNIDFNYIILTIIWLMFVFFQFMHPSFDAMGTTGLITGIWMSRTAFLNKNNKDDKEDK